MNFVNMGANKLLNMYLAIRYWLSFHKIIIDVSEIQNKINPDLPTLLIANHCSWWDGFFIREVYKKLNLKKEFKIVMLESELKKFPFFRLCGAVGLIPKNTDHNMKIFSALKNSCVCFFPQGEITAQAARPLVFKTGIKNLILKLHPVQIISIAMHIEPFQFMKPTALIKAGSLDFSSTAEVDVENMAFNLEKILDDIVKNWTTQIYSQKFTVRK